jgi:Ca2+-binding EF-hand superfamily protein
MPRETHPTDGVKSYDCVDVKTRTNGVVGMQSRGGLVLMDQNNADNASWDVSRFLGKFQPPKPPVDLNKDGFVDRKELMTAFLEAGANQKTAEVTIEGFFDIIDTKKEDKIRTDIFYKEFVNMGKYLAIFDMKQAVDSGALHMLTKSDGKRDVFFTKEEVGGAFAHKLGQEVAAKVTDSTFAELDTNKSSFMDMRKLCEWYNSHSIHLRAITLRQNIRLVAAEESVRANRGQVLQTIEQVVEALKALILNKKRKERRELKRVGSPTYIALNRAVGKAMGLLEFLSTVSMLSEQGEPVVDASLADCLRIPILEAIKLGAWDGTPGGLPKTGEDSDDEY